jgi:hypothetical protein
MPAPKWLRDEFERKRRQGAFIAALPAGGIGIIAADTWITPWAGPPGGVIAGLMAYVVVYAYESAMWRRHHG